MKRALLTSTLLFLLSGIAPGQGAPLNKLQVAEIDGTGTRSWTSQPAGRKDPIAIRVGAAEGSCILLFVHAWLDPGLQHEDEAIRMRHLFPWLARVSRSGAQLLTPQNAALAQEVDETSQNALLARPPGTVQVLPEAIVETVVQCVGFSDTSLAQDADLVKAYGQCVLLNSQATQVWDAGVTSWSSFERRDGTSSAALWSAMVAGESDELGRRELLRFAIEEQARFAGYETKYNTAFLDALTTQCGEIGMSLTLQAAVMTTDPQGLARAITNDPSTTRGLDCIDTRHPPNSSGVTRPGLVLLDPVVVAIRLGDPEPEPGPPISMFPSPWFPGMSAAPPPGYAYTWGDTAYFHADETLVDTLWLRNSSGVYITVQLFDSGTLGVVYGTIPPNTTFCTAFFSGPGGVVSNPEFAWEGGVIYTDIPQSVMTMPWIP